MIWKHTPLFVHYKTKSCIAINNQKQFYMMYLIFGILCIFSIFFNLNKVLERLSFYLLNEEKNIGQWGRFGTDIVVHIITVTTSTPSRSHTAYYRPQRSSCKRKVWYVRIREPAWNSVNCSQGKETNTNIIIFLFSLFLTFVTSTGELKRKKKRTKKKEWN
jgi:fumarate reductase subunit C